MGKLYNQTVAVKSMQLFFSIVLSYGLKPLFSSAILSFVIVLLLTLYYSNGVVHLLPPRVFNENCAGARVCLQADRSSMQ